MLRHVAYSCDSTNASSGDNVFSAVSLRRIGPAGCASCPGANISECWVSPASVWAQLEPLPPGRRAISLEGSADAPYYCERANGTRWWMDPLDDGSAGPWGDVWAAEVKRRFTAWFDAFAQLGGTVDVVLSDYEIGGHAYW